MFKINRYIYFFTYSIATCLISAPEFNKIVDERVWIENTYLPALSGSVLYIGVGSYTTMYHTLVQDPKLFETIDFLEERAIYGCPFKHHVGDFMSLNENIKYDNVSFFGVLGYHKLYFGPFRTMTQILDSLNKADSLVKNNGTLQIGANHSLIEGQDVNFWSEIFNNEIFDKYVIISYSVSPHNVIWWGRKTK